MQCVCVKEIERERERHSEIIYIGRERVNMTTITGIRIRYAVRMSVCEGD